MRRVIGRMVSATGHQVETAADAAEARDWLVAASFSLVTCDVHDTFVATRHELGVAH